MTTNLKTCIELSFEPMDLRTTHPFGISYGTSTVTENVLVKLKWGKHTGYGECAPASYHGEKRSTVMALLNDWQKDELLGDDPFAIAETMRRLDRKIAGHGAAKAGVEMAMQDLLGKLLEKPTYRVLGLAGLQAPMTDFTIGIDSLEVVESKTKEAVQAGFKILKVKQGTAHDREIIRAVRKVATDLPVRVDANGGWTPKQAVEMARWLFDQGIEFIEQPLPKHAPIADWRYVREHSPLPIFADESIARAPDVVRMAGVIDGVVVKLAKTGGLYEALKLVHTARAHDLKLMFGCMIESSIGVTAACHLAPLFDYLDLDGALLLAKDPFEGAVYKDGYLEIPDAPGLGVKPRG